MKMAIQMIMKIVYFTIDLLNGYLIGGLEHEFLFFHILGMSSSPLTNSYFLKLVKTTEPAIIGGIYARFSDTLT